MSNAIEPRREGLPWYLWPFYLPVALAVVLVASVVFAPIALLSILYFTIYPERHAHLYDWEGNERQKLLLAKLRTKYRQLTIWQRIGRGYILWCRKRQRSKLADPRYVPKMIRDSRARNLRDLKEEQ